MKKQFQTALCVCLILSARISLAGPCLESYKGDMSGEGGITLADAVIALEIAAGTGTHAPPSTSDVDGNQTIGLEEVVYVLQVVAGLRPDIPTIQVRLESEFQKAGIGLENYPTTGEEDLTPFTFKNNLGPNGADEIIIRYARNEHNCGDPPLDSYPDNLPCTDLPLLTTKEEISPTQSQVEVQEDLNDPSYSAWENGCYCYGEVFSPPQYSLPILIKTPAGHEPAAAAAFELAHVQTTALTSHLLIQPYGDTPLQITFPVGSTISFLHLQPIESIRFFIDSNNTLMREDVTEPGATPLFDSVRNIQIAFGLDRDQNGIVDDWIGDDSGDAFDTDGDLFENEKDLVISICLILIE